MFPLTLVDVAPQIDVAKEGRPEQGINTLIMKVSSRCNLNCSYCYVYNLEDDTWKTQPKFMSDAHFRLALERWKEHVQGRQVRRLHFILHGGEPLLAGAARLDRWLTTVREVMDSSGCEVAIGIQSNGLLLNDSICSVLSRHNTKVGVSLDGIPGKGDQYRVDHSGAPSGQRLEDKLNWIKASKWRDCLGGILSVVNIGCDPLETLDYVMSFEPNVIDFRLPLCNHDSPPNRPPSDSDRTAYGRWLARIFDKAVETDLPCRIRVLDGIINGGRHTAAYQNLVGNTELTQACVIESDGTYELADNLKATSNGITKTGLRLESHSMDQFGIFAARWRARHQLHELRALGLECSGCRLYEQCAGHYYPARYSAARLFDGPSVYCSDLKYLFDHVNRRMLEL